jgi:type IV secretion system protein VirD4
MNAVFKKFTSTRIASTAPSPPRFKRPWARLATRALALLAVVLALSQYFAGVFFLWSVKEDLKAASPLTIARYHYYYGEDPAVEKRLLVCSGAGGALVLAAAIAFIAPRRRALYGAARFARRGEIADAGLLGNRGIILGRLGRRCLMLAGQQGVALAAPPRAGKGTGVVVPNLLNWPDSVLCLDIKRENWTLTAGFRQRFGQECFLFDPFAEDGRTAHWNPFFYVSDEREKRVNDLQRIAEMLYPDPPNVDPFWTASARSLFLGIALYLFETESLPKTIGEVLRQGMASDAEGFGHHWKRVIEGRRNGPASLSAECVRALYDVIDLAPVTASSIRKTFTSRLDLWLNPILDQATASNDFDLRELRRKPLSIYIGVNPDDLHRLRPVLALFFQQAIGLQTRVLPEHDRSLTRQVLIVLDEFGALGKIPIIAESISYLPGYNVRLLLVIHTPAQLREAYGQHLTETMMKSLAARIVFAPKDMADARAISEELGFVTVQVRTISRPGWTFFKGKGRTPTINISEQGRPLLLPQEVKELTSEESLLFYEGIPPIRCQKIRYFRDPRFQKRLLPPPVIPKPPVPSASPSPTTGAPEAQSKPAGREATAADIERIDSIELEEFEADLRLVQIPEANPMSCEQMALAVESYLSTLKHPLGECHAQ